MSLVQRTYFSQDVFNMTDIALVLIINHYPVKWMYLFRDTQYLEKYQSVLTVQVKILIIMNNNMIIL